MATTGHLFEEMKATYRSLGIAGKVAGKFHWDDLSSVYMTVGDADTFWHPQFFSTDTQWAFRQLWKKCGVELRQRGIRRIL